MRRYMRLSRMTRRVTIVALAAMALAACQRAGSSPRAATGSAATPGPGAIKVVTTTTVFAVIMQNVGGSRLVATSVIRPGVGPEVCEPKLGYTRKTADPTLRQ